MSHSASPSMFQEPPATTAPSGSRFRAKRLFDLALLLPTLPLFVPLTGVLALFVLIREGRPVFFLQSRVTTGGARFNICKLRTMSQEQDVSARTPTALGAWLRHRGLDELPQLWNVFVGEMSLVGPRPLLQSDIDRLTKIAPEFGDRIQVPPGLTGLPQICLARGAARTAALDAHYARTSTVPGDLGILLRSAWINVVGKKRGARPLPPGLS